MNSMRRFWKALLGILVIALIPLALIGCAEGDDDASGEQPTGEKAAEEHPAGEQPTKEKAAEEHPAG